MKPRTPLKLGLGSQRPCGNRHWVCISLGRPAPVAPPLLPRTEGVRWILSQRFTIIYNIDRLCKHVYRIVFVHSGYTGDLENSTFKRKSIFWLQLKESFSICSTLTLLCESKQRWLPLLYSIIKWFKTSLDLALEMY